MLHCSCFILRLYYVVYMAGESMGGGKMCLARGIHCCPNFLKFLLPDQSLCIVNNICAYIHTSDCVQTVYELLSLPNNTAVKHFYTNREWCKVYIYCWEAGFAVTGWIHDIGQKVLQYSFETGSSSSSHSYCWILFLMAFLEEAFIRNVIILWCISNKI